MKRILAYVACVAAVTPSASVAQPTILQVYFSAEPLTAGGVPVPLPMVGIAGNNNLPQPGRSLDGPRVTNPVLIDSVGGRLFIWATGSIGIVAPNVWDGLSLEIEITGPATINGGGCMNVRRTAAPTYRRWETNADYTQPSFNFYAIVASGISFPVVRDGFDSGRDKVLLGYLDFPPSSGYSEIRFATFGFSRLNGERGSDAIIFGDDTELIRGQVPFLRRSELADAFIVVPEPASGVLLVVAGLALRRGRGRAGRARYGRDATTHILDRAKRRRRGCA